MKKIIRQCEKCHCITEAKKCLLCGKETVVVSNKKEKRKELQFEGKASSKIKRFPRLPGEAEKANEKEIRIIEGKCLEFNVPGKIIGVKVGPVVTEFDFMPMSNSRFRVKTLRNMHEDLAMAIGRDTCSITRVTGGSAVAIMLPNLERKMPSFQDLLPGYLKHRNTMEIPLNMGVDSLGNQIVMDLATMPHLLVAGETGAGKSVFLNTMITSLLWARSPKQLRFMFIDSKSVELSSYKDIPHIDGAVATDIWSALAMLERAEQEMRKRMGVINLHHCKNFRELNAKLEPEDRLPYVVIVIDEMADLVLQEKKEFIKKMAILSSMARAAGVHVIAATQRPSVDVLSGKVKVNFPSRVAFHVPSSADSKTIINSKGAEQLMGKGDAFAILPGQPGLVRLHMPHCTEVDIKRILRASITVGHHFRTPAEMTDKELAQLEKDMAAAQKASLVNNAVGKSLADMLDENDRPGIVAGKERVN
jgi:S-DNA-T family DNA segregation ATPase FtsK/SpoIIIE